MKTACNGLQRPATACNELERIGTSFTYLGHKLQIATDLLAEIGKGAGRPQRRLFEQSIHGQKKTKKKQKKGGGAQNGASVPQVKNNK